MYPDRADYEELYQSTDPFYGEESEPGDLLSQYQAMQEAWRRSEEGQTATTPPWLTPVGQEGLMPGDLAEQRLEAQPPQPSRR
jgi:hypothetical protein